MNRWVVVAVAAAMVGCSEVTGTAPDGGCEVTSSSTLPGVRIALSPEACVYRAGSKQPLTVRYEVIIDAPVEGFVPNQPYFNGVDVANLDLSEVLDGQGHHYCVCDLGPNVPACPLPDGGQEYSSAAKCGPVTLPAGTFPRRFTWDGTTWNGPSDTHQALGPAFPPGTYVLTVRTAPGRVGDGGVDLEAVGTLKVVVAP